MITCIFNAEMALDDMGENGKNKFHHAEIVVLWDDTFSTTQRYKLCLHKSACILNIHLLFIDIAV